MFFYSLVRGKCMWRRSAVTDMWASCCRGQMVLCNINFVIKPPHIAFTLDFSSSTHVVVSSAAATPFATV